MGGSDPCNFTLKALHIIKDSGFKGAIDVVLGFDDVHYDVIRSFLNTLENESKIYTDANMPKLIYDADIGIGAAGISAWERQCLGLPQFLFLASTNQIENKKLFPDAYEFKVQDYKCYHHRASSLFDGLGVQRVADAVEALYSL
jgi:spore coat polysaccharide biosynthesis predicted glycosyltransferase SpsG